MYISGRNVEAGETKRLRRGLKDLSEYDKSQKLPDVESCCLAFQWLLRDASKRCAENLVRIRELGRFGGGIGNIADEEAADGDVDAEGRVPHSRLELTVEKIWFAYLNSWMKASSYYSRKYPEMRVSFRDYFVENSRKRLIYQHLSVKLGKQIEEELIEKFMNELREKEGKQDSMNINEGEHGFETNDGVADTPEATKKSSVHCNSKKCNTANQAPKRTNDRRKMQHKRRPILGTTVLNKLIFRSKIIEFPNGIYDMKSREAALRIHPSLTLILSILQLALNHLKTGIAPHHLTTWVANGVLPHALNGYALLPLDLRDKVVMAKKFFARSFVPPASVVAEEVKVLAAACDWYESPCGEDMMKAMEDSSDNPFNKSVYNVPLLASRMVMELGLNQEVLNKVMVLMGVDQEKEIRTSEKVSNDLSECHSTKQFPDLKSAHFENLYTPLHVAAVIVVACKLCHGWEKWKITRRFPDERNDSESKQNYSKLLPLIPWNLPQLQLLGNGPSLERYLKFMEQIAFNSLVEPSDKFKNVLNSLPKDDPDSAIETDAARATKKLKVTPNLVLAGEPVEKDIAGTQKRSRSKKNHSYYESHNYYLYGGRKILPTEPYSPHYCRLVEYICYVMEEPKPSKLHCLVEKIEDELFSKDEIK